MTLPRVEVASEDERITKLALRYLLSNPLAHPVGPIVVINEAIDREVVFCLAHRVPTKQEQKALQVYVMLNHPRHRRIKVYVEELE